MKGYQNPEEKREEKMRRILTYILVLLLASFIAAMAMAGVALIPRDRIQKQLEESAEYLTQHEEHFPYQLIDGMNSTNLDEVADANLLNVATYFDEKRPLESAMWARWYFTGYGNENEGFYRAVMEGEEANDLYLRYWHGSLLLVRPLLLFLNIKQLYVFNSVVMAVLLLGLLYIMLKNNLKTEALSFTISMIAVSAWIVPGCLEFTWMFLLMEVVSIVEVKWALSGKDLDMLFFITGIVTIFLDFLTTELLTVLIPLLLALRIRTRQGKNGNWRFAIKSCFLWGIGYIAMWVMKWEISALILGRGTMGAVMYQAGLHLSVESGMSNLRFLFSTLQKNIGCLLPFDFGWIATVVFAGMVLALFIAGFKRNRITARKPSGIIWIYLTIGLMPYVRYAVIRHHSWVHYFFTYRAQAATVMALCFSIAEVVGMNRQGKRTVDTGARDYG